MTVLQTHSGLLDSSDAGVTDKAPDSLLQTDLARLDLLLGEHLARLRRRGRTPLSEPLAGAVIEDGEAEGLLAELMNEHVRGVPRVASLAGADRGPSGVGLLRAGQLFGLDAFELDVLLLCLAVELDSRYARLIAYLNDHAAQTRPTVGLTLSVFGGGPQWLARFQPHAPLRAYQLLELEAEGPLSGRTLRLPETFWPWLVPLPFAATTFELCDTGPALDALVLDPSVRGELDAISARARATPRASVVIRGPAGSGRHAIASALASTLRSRLLLTDLEQALSAPKVLRREALWHDAVVLVRAHPSPAAGASATSANFANPSATAPARLNEAATALAALEAPVIGVGLDGLGEALALVGRPVLELALPAPSDALRGTLLRALLANTAHERIDTDAIAARFRFGPGRWQAAISVALERARTARGPRASLRGDELEAAGRSLPALQFGDLAQPLEARYTRDDLIVPAQTDAELALALAWARHGSRVLETWGLGRTLPGGRGLTCLFFGPPGTGKTLAAQVLAREIGLDLYRIDLSQVVSKYIGESEKNLTRIFDEAQAANVILFFDEADALFGKRTKVEDAHDRYANIEVSFLLQRMELHPGITILATNLRQNLDDAFLRRLHVVAEFPTPGRRERALIWRRHLPGPDACAPDIDVDFLSSRFELSGGEIRNATLTAGFLAAAEGSVIAMRHLCCSVYRELLKTGRLVDPSAFGAWHEALATRSPR